LDLNLEKITPPLGNPEVGMSGQVLVHPSHICQIGGGDQDPIADSNRSAPRPSEISLPARVVPLFTRGLAICLGGCVENPHE
jgi:hypothetical protein